jgi:glutamine synthetase
VHFSLLTADGTPVNHDPGHPHGLSTLAGSFVSGILGKMPAIAAVTAAATISYLRLTPNRWSASFSNLGWQDREAGVRICPVFEGDVARQYHFEYRAADAAGSPYVVLGAILAAGLHGLDRGLPMPPVTESAPQDMGEAERARLGIERLPQSLGAALDRFEADSDLTEAFGAELKAAYLAHKRFEAGVMEALDPAAQCERYRLAY